MTGHTCTDVRQLYLCVDGSGNRYARHGGDVPDDMIAEFPCPASLVMDATEMWAGERLTPDVIYSVIRSVRA